MDGSRIMLADFGLSRTEEEARRGEAADAINSAGYRPPELLRSGKRQVQFGTEVDVWALGATVFDIASFGNAKGPNIMMAHYFLHEDAARMLFLVLSHAPPRPRNDFSSLEQHAVKSART